MDMEKVLKQVAQNWRGFLDTNKTGYAQGMCYENAGQFVMRKKEFEGSSLLLCHGEVFSHETEIYHGHAWVEWGDGVGMVLDPSTGKPEPMIAGRSTYYLMGKINPDRVKRFTADDLVHKVDRHPHWGPWE